VLALASNQAKKEELIQKKTHLMTRKGASCSSSKVLWLLCRVCVLHKSWSPTT
jgi:hypothetical protein